MGRKKKQQSPLLTVAELKIMKVIWDIGPSTVHEVREHLDEELDYKYNTVSTIMRSLEQKGVLIAEKQGRGCVYIPTTQKEDYQNVEIGNLLDTLFQGSTLGLVKGLIGGKRVSQEEIAAIKELLNQWES